MKDVRKKGATAHLNKEEAEEVEEGAYKTAPGYEGEVPGSDSKTYKPQAASTGDTQGVLGKTTGAALDAGGDKDVGKLKEEEQTEEDAISEEYKEKAEIIFEAAVGERVNIIREELEDQLAEAYAQEVEKLNEQVAGYVEAAVQEWIKENALEVRYSLRTEIAENFIKGLKGLFEESYIEIPEDDASVVDELTEAVEEQKEEIESLQEQLVKANAFILESRKTEVISSLCEDLTQTQAVRFEKLAEGLEASDVEEFKAKAEQLKEGYFDPTAEQPMVGSLTEEVLTGEIYEEVDDSSPVNQYANFLSRTVLK